MRTGLLLLAGILFLGTMSCSLLPDRPAVPRDLPAEAEDALARLLIDRLSTVNQHLETFKGIGRFRLRNEKGTFTSRVAWAAATDGRLRIEVLGIGGQPLASFATDGTWFFALTRDPLRFYKKQTGSASLDRLISIPVKTRDILSILAGRVPLYPHSAARVHTGKAGSGYVLELKKRWHGTIEKIYFDAENKAVTQFEVFDSAGALVYRTVYGNISEINGYRIPATLVLSDAGPVNFQLEIQRFWPDVSLTDAVFTLEAPSD